VQIGGLIRDLPQCAADRPRGLQGGAHGQQRFREEGDPARGVLRGQADVACAPHGDLGVAFQQLPRLAGFVEQPYSRGILLRGARCEDSFAGGGEGSVFRQPFEHPVQFQNVQRFFIHQTEPRNDFPAMIL
jgi:hypothetical protein